MQPLAWHNRYIRQIRNSARSVRCGCYSTAAALRSVADRGATASSKRAGGLAGGKSPHGLAREVPGGESPWPGPRSLARAAPIRGALTQSSACAGWPRPLRGRVGTRRRCCAPDRARRPLRSSRRCGEHSRKRSGGGAVVITGLAIRDHGAGGDHAVGAPASPGVVWNCGIAGAAGWPLLGSWTGA